MTETTEPRRRPIGAVLAMAGGALAILGSFLAWKTVTSDLFGVSSATGMKLGDGTITLTLGIVLALLGLAAVFLASPQGRRGVAVAALIFGVAVVGIAAFNMFDIKANATDQFVSENGGDPATLTDADRAQLEEAFSFGIGPGLYVVLAGGALAVAGGVLGLRTGPGRSPAPVPASPPAGP